MSYLIFLYFLGFVVWMVDTYLHKRMQKDCYHLVKECSLQPIYWQSVVISAPRILVRQHSIRVSYTLPTARYGN